jgi:hypothetical protein
MLNFPYKFSLCFLWYFFFVSSVVVEWYSYFTKFHKGLDMQQFSFKFSLSFPKWCSGIAIPQISTKESQSFTKDSTCYIFLLNFLCVFCRGGVVIFLCVFCDFFSLCFLWYIYFTKFHKGHLMLNFTFKFSLSFPKWWSGIAISPSFIKDAQSFTKDWTCNSFFLNFL